MMFNIVLLDDEEYIIRSLSSSVDWRKNGFNLTATFTNPLRALEYIKINTVDVVISDVKMPILNGLDFVKKLQEFKPKVKAVLLSGYGEFEYARKAIEYNAFLYLLKPISITTLEDVLHKLHSSLERERGTITIDSLINLATRKTFLNFVYSEITPQKFCEEMNQEQIAIDNNTVFMGVTVTLVDLEYYIGNIFTYGIERLHIAICQLINKRKNNFILVNANIDKMEIVFIGNDDVKTFVEKVYEECNSLFSNVLDLLNLHIELKYDYLKTNYRMLQEISSNSEYMQIEAETMLNNFNKKNGENVIKSIRLLSKSFVSYDEFQYVLWEKVILALLNNPEKSKFEKIKKIVELLNTTFKDIDELEKYVITNCELFTTESNEKQSQDMIGIIKSYVEAHYNEDISLTEVSELVSRNPSYLSRFFKKETGEKYIDYINRVRLSKCIDMILNTNEMIYVIAQKVGYKDINYFYKLFKEKVGCSPQQLREDRVVK